jgi:hypothetical protein
MKRTDALAEITSILDTEHDLDNPSKSELILVKLEEMGMLPPRTNLSYLYDIEDNAWEDE